MKPTIATIETPTNPDLAPAREALAQCIRVDVEPVESAWEAFERRADFAADQEREVLRPRLARAYEKREARARSVAVEEEVEQIIRSLWPEYLRKREELDAAYQTMLREIDAPSSAAFLAFYELTWQVETLRAALYAVTRMPELRSPFDAVTALERHWRTVHEKRTRLYTHTLAPGSRPRLTVSSSPWADSIGRLSQLRASRKQETAHATV